MALTKVLLTLICTNLVLLQHAASYLAPPTIRASLARTASPRSDYARQVARSKLRSSMLLARATVRRRPVDGVRPTLRTGVNDYIMELAIGTPPVRFWAEADTGSDLTWTQCVPCTHCFPQPTPLFDPVRSSSFTKISRRDSRCHHKPAGNRTKPCKYLFRYANGDYTSGYLATDTFTIGAATAPGVAFGCGTANRGSFGNSAGLVGLGRGNLSLVNQLNFSNFSYCLIYDGNKTCPLIFGTPPGLFKESNEIIQSTPLRPGPMYYVTLLGISVGGRHVPIPEGTFDRKPDGSGGVIFDTGAAITTLERAAYRHVRKAFLSQMRYPVANASGSAAGLDLCFQVGAGRNVTAATVPSMTLHLAGGADMYLPMDNYFDEVAGTDGVWCLMIVPTRGLSAVGSFMQMNVHILYDVKNSVMSFQPADCSNLRV